MRAAEECAHVSEDLLANRPEFKTAIVNDKSRSVFNMNSGPIAGRVGALARVGELSPPCNRDNDTAGAGAALATTLFKKMFLAAVAMQCYQIKCHGKNDVFQKYHKNEHVM